MVYRGFLPIILRPPLNARAFFGNMELRGRSSHPNQDGRNGKVMPQRLKLRNNRVFVGQNINPRVRVLLREVAIDMPRPIRVLRHGPLEFGSFLQSQRTGSIRRPYLRLVIYRAMLLATTSVMFPIPRLLQGPILASLYRGAAKVLGHDPLGGASSESVGDHEVRGLRCPQVGSSTLTRQSPSLRTYLDRGLLQAGLKRNMRVVFHQNLELVGQTPIVEQVTITVLNRETCVCGPRNVQVQLY